MRHLLRQPLPTIEGRREVKGLEGNVEIIRDRWGVPHVYAHSLADLMFAFGYVQAQDRLWQMEFHRRLGSGTLSEVVGRQALEVDQLNRCLGFRRLAERHWWEASDQERLALEAFSAGVNTHIEQGSLPVEFNLPSLSAQSLATDRHDRIQPIHGLESDRKLGRRDPPLLD